MGTLDAFLATAVETPRRFLVVVRRDFEIRKGSQMLAQLVELRAVGDPGKKLLANRADHDHTVVIDQRYKFTVRPRVNWSIFSTQDQRPNRGVDQHLHRLRRFFL